MCFGAYLIKGEYPCYCKEYNGMNMTEIIDFISQYAGEEAAVANTSKKGVVYPLCVISEGNAVEEAPQNGDIYIVRPDKTINVLTKEEFQEILD